MNSKRLPGKHLYKVLNRPIIEYLFLRLKKVKNVDEIILATTNSHKDDVLEKIALKNKIKVFRGSEKNVMQRVLHASRKYKIDVIISITADCPLIDPDIVDSCILTFLNNNCDYLNNSLIPSYPGGMNCQVYYKKTLEKSFQSRLNSNHKEHVTLEIANNNKKYKHLYLCAPTDLHRPNIRVELDTIEDFKFIKKIIIQIKKNRYYFNCSDLINLIEKKKI